MHRTGFGLLTIGCALTVSCGAAPKLCKTIADCAAAQLCVQGQCRGGFIYDKTDSGSASSDAATGINP